MLMTLVIGLAILGVSAALVWPMVFSQRSEPATAVAPETGTSAEMTPSAMATSAMATSAAAASAVSPSAVSPSAVRTIRVPERVSIHPSWPQRVRGVVGLLLVTFGGAAAIAVVVGGAVLVVSVAIGG